MGTCAREKAQRSLTFGDSIRKGGRTMARDDRRFYQAEEDTGTMLRRVA
jgi:hypothetical protein